MTKNTLLAISAAAILLTACGESKTDRALSGAGIGAVGGGLLGGTNGALIGGAAGAAAGGLTKKEDVNLGKPVWR